MLFKILKYNIIIMVIDMKSKKKKLDIVIYCSLFAAIICVIASGIDYTHSIKGDNTLKEDVKEAIEEIKTPKVEEPVIEEETQDLEIPSSLQELDKNELVKKHIDEILDYYTKDEAIRYAIVKSWGNYEVYDATYLRKITDDYYSYQIKIKLDGTDPILPVNKNEELSSEGSIVIIMNANFARNKQTFDFYVKTLEIPQQN